MGFSPVALATILIRNNEGRYCHDERLIDALRAASKLAFLL